MRKITCFFSLFILLSCASEKKEVQTNGYFDVASFFKNEAKRLTLKNESIEKTVRINGKKERRELTISNWERELDAFIAADINKASWKGAFSIAKSPTTETYTTDNKKIAVKKLEVTKDGNKVVGVKIFIDNSNDLYSSTDSLSYYTDQSYEIKKVQRIKLMEEKKYEISARFK